MRPTADVLAAILIGAVLVAACGGEPAPVTPAASPDPLRVEPPPAPAKPEAPRRARWERIAVGLADLARSQNADGSWGAGSDPGLTGFVLLSFFSNGETHRSGQHRNAIKAGLGFLKRAQGETGGFAPGEVATPIESQLPAALAMTEAYGLTGSRLVHEPAERAFRFLLARQNGDGGWGESTSNASATIWGVMVLKSASMAEVGVDAEAMARASRWMASIADLPNGRVAWNREGAANPGWPLPSLSGDALFAGAIVTRVFAGEGPRTSNEVRRAASLLLERGQSWGAESDPDRADDWWLGTVAMWQADNVVWVPWCEALWRALDARELPTTASGDGQQRTMSDDEVRLVAAHILTARSTQGYRRVFPSEDR